MSIRSGELCIVRVCTEHFLSSGRVANSFSLSAAPEGCCKPLQPCPCWVAPYRDGTPTWVSRWAGSDVPCSLHPALPPVPVLVPPWSFPHHPSPGALCHQEPEQLRLPGEPGGTQGRGQKFSQRSVRSLGLSRCCQHVCAWLCLRALTAALVSGAGRHWDSPGFGKLTWPGPSWLLCHTSICQTCCS